MTDIAHGEKLRTRDAELRRRAASVIPAGMFGHMSVGRLPDAYWEGAAPGAIADSQTLLYDRSTAIRAPGPLP